MVKCESSMRFRILTIRCPTYDPFVRVSKTSVGLGKCKVRLGHGWDMAK